MNTTNITSSNSGALGPILAPQKYWLYLNDALWEKPKWKLFYKNNEGVYIKNGVILHIPYESWTTLMNVWILMTFRLPTWLFTLHRWLVDFHFTLHFPILIHEVCGTWWLMTRHEMTFMAWTAWWHGNVKSPFSVAFFVSSWNDGACFSSSSSLWLEGKESSMCSWYYILCYNLVFIHLLS